MKGYVLCLVLAFTGVAGAHELDNDLAVTERDAAAMLPQTTVIRVNNETKAVEVMHLATRLNPGQKLENAKFEQVAINTEIQGIKFEASNELDATSSTSAWRYGYPSTLPAYRPNYAYGYRPNYGYGYGYRPYYGYGSPNFNNYYANYGSYYYPRAASYYTVANDCYAGAVYNSACVDGGYYASYRVANYAYVARPYYTYATPAYSYYYCGW